MKTTTFQILLIGLFVLATGIAMADPGISATTETQGITITTSIIAVGNFYSNSDIAWKTTTSGGGLTGVPPLSDGALYQAVYTEDTMSNGVGQIWYDKSLSLDTGEQLNGQSNIEATKQLAFIGYDGAQVHSDEYIMVSGSGNPAATNDAAICVFAGSASDTIPAFCNRVEAGSSIDMSVVNMRTSTNARFIVPSADTPTALNHNIRVDELDGEPSIGKVSAFMQGIIQEGRGSKAAAFENIEFTESVSIDGEIHLFDKNMGYISGVKR
jgi:hypothetical protein